MVTEWDQYNNPSKGMYRDPKTEFLNMVLLTNGGKQQILYPFGVEYTETKSEGKQLTKMLFPDYYERIFSSEENWQEKCYNVIQCASNRHFWFTLTLEKKAELYNFLMGNLKVKVFKMANTYTFEDLLVDLTTNQFSMEHSDVVMWIMTKDNGNIISRKNLKYSEYGNDYLLLESIKPWEKLSYDSVKKYLTSTNLDKAVIFIHPGQYIMNFTDPY